MIGILGNKVIIVDLVWLQDVPWSVMHARDQVSGAGGVPLDGTCEWRMPIACEKDINNLH